MGGGGNGVATSSLTTVAFGCTDVAVKSFPFNVTPMLGFCLPVTSDRQARHTWTVSLLDSLTTGPFVNAIAKMSD